MYKIQKILKKWKKESGAMRVIQYTYKNGLLTIYTSQPGWLIGKKGELANKYKQIFKKEIPDFKDLTFIETEYYWV